MTLTLTPRLLALVTAAPQPVSALDARAADSSDVRAQEYSLMDMRRRWGMHDGHIIAVAKDATDVDGGGLGTPSERKWSKVRFTDDLLQGITRVSSYSVEGIGRSDSSKTGWTALTKWVGLDSDCIAPGPGDVMSQGASGFATDDI
jgi:hypothetical protein